MFKLKRTELESRIKKESDNKIPAKNVGHLKMRRVKQKEDNWSLYRTRDAHSAMLQECDDIIDVTKHLDVQQVNKLGHPTVRIHIHNKHLTMIRRQHTAKVMKEAQRKMKYAWK